MRKCLYKYCRKNIDNKRKDAIFCSLECSSNQRTLPDWQDVYINDYEMGKRMEEYSKRAVKSENAKRWANIYKNSSFDAMRSVFELFKR